MGLALAIMLPAQSFALSMLCSESLSSGFNWDGAQSMWTPARYDATSYIVRKLAPGTDPVDGLNTSGCFDAIVREGQSTEPLTQGALTRAHGCYSLAPVGEKPTVFDIGHCTEFYGNGAEISRVECEAPFMDWQFFPTGEFTLTRTAAAPARVEDSVAARDSLTISVGACSVIAP